MKLCEWWRLNIQKFLHRRLADNAPHTQNSNIADGFVFSISVWNVSCCCFFVFHDGNWKLLSFGSFFRPNKVSKYVHLHFGMLGFWDTSPNSSPDMQANALVTCNLWPSNINLSRKDNLLQTVQTPSSSATASRSTACIRNLTQVSVTYITVTPGVTVGNPGPR